MSRKSLKLLLSLFLVAILSLVVVLGVKAATSDSVACTVTAQEIAVSVSDGGVDYGTMALDTSAGTNSSDTQTATNDGNITEDFDIKGQDSSPGSWVLDSTNGANHYVHKFCISSCDSPPTNYTALSTDYQDLADDIISSGDQTFDLYITTPTSTSDYTEQSVDVTVLASAS